MALTEEQVQRLQAIAKFRAWEWIGTIDREERCFVRIGNDALKRWNPYHDSEDAEELIRWVVNRGFALKVTINKNYAFAACRIDRKSERWFRTAEPGGYHARLTATVDAIYMAALRKVSD